MDLSCPNCEPSDAYSFDDSLQYNITVHRIVSDMALSDENGDIYDYGTHQSTEETIYAECDRCGEVLHEK